MNYDELKQINDKLRRVVPKEQLAHVENVVFASDEVCSIKYHNTIKKVKIRQLVSKIEHREICLSNPSALTNWNFDKGMKMNISDNVSYGQTLDELLMGKEKLKPRQIVKSILNYCNNSTNGKICGVYGLRRTGKTYALFHSIIELKKQGKECAYILLSVNDSLKVLYDDINELVANGYDYIFIDEITYVTGFLQSANKLSDIFAQRNIHITISGTFSYLLKIAGNTTLYDRLYRVNSTYIGYKEYDALHTEEISIIDYIHKGGILSTGGFSNEENAKNYVKTAISENIQNSLIKADNRKAYSHLLDLYDRNLLSKVVEQAIQATNETLTVNTIKKMYQNNDLGSSIQKLADVFDYEHTLDIDNIEAFVAYMLHVVRQEQSIIDREYLNELIGFLIDLDVVVKYDRDNGVNTMNVVLFTQPGLRYYQTEILIEALRYNNSFAKLDRQFQDLLIEKIIQGIEGDLIEHEVLASCIKHYMQSAHILQVSDQETNGEWDMVIAYEEFMDIYEIKRSDKRVENQCRWLVDERMRAKYERRLHRTIRDRYVLYRGEDADLMHKNYRIKYRNVETYLQSI